jgi:L-2-hydroxycarboxylate dehydrogenase (NAD+)
MEQPPPDSFRVDPDRLHRFVDAAARALGIPEAQAATLARDLIDCDLRGVASHGSALVQRYMREVRNGRLNPAPELSTVHETANSLVVDGDGGLGYFPAHYATRRAIEMADQNGMAAAVTRNHGHIGAAGIYTRLSPPRDQIAFMTSGVQLDLKPGDPIYRAAGMSPMSFSAPAQTEPALVFDCGVTHDLQGENPAPPYRDAVARLTPGIVLRAIGFGTICQAWGGLLTGMPVDAARAEHPYTAAHQGAFFFTCRIDLFGNPDEFKREIDAYAQRVRELTPLSGTAGAFLPGHLEVAHERAYRRDGIPLGERHRRRLSEVAEELGLEPPWE